MSPSWHGNRSSICTYQGSQTVPWFSFCFCFDSSFPKWPFLLPVFWYLSSFIRQASGFFWLPRFAEWRVTLITQKDLRIFTFKMWKWGENQPNFHAFTRIYKERLWANYNIYREGGTLKTIFKKKIVWM